MTKIPHNLIYTVPKNYKSIVSHYPEIQVGNARIKKVTQKRGIYWMEAVDGYIFYRLSKPITITELQVYEDGEWTTWMIDDPLHDTGMKRLAEHSYGKVLCGGLGLGIIIHYLVVNPKVEEIDVVEINPDVIKLIKPLLPRDNRINIINADYYQYIASTPKQYDTIIIDILVGMANPLMAIKMNALYTITRAYQRNAKIWIWGTLDHKTNPAVDPKVSKLLIELRKKQLHEQ